MMASKAKRAITGVGGELKVIGVGLQEENEDSGSQRSEFGRAVDNLLDTFDE